MHNTYGSIRFLECIAVVSLTTIGEFTSFYSSESENAILVNNVNTVHAVLQYKSLKQK